jgi:hypothetical protein
MEKESNMSSLGGRGGEPVAPQDPFENPPLSFANVWQAPRPGLATSAESPYSQVAPLIVVRASSSDVGDLRRRCFNRFSLSHHVVECRSRSRSFICQELGHRSYKCTSQGATPGQPMCRPSSVCRCAFGSNRSSECMEDLLPHPKSTPFAP